MELGVVVGFGVWGFHIGSSTATKALLTIVVPLAGFGFWGAVDFRQLGTKAEAARLLQELVISGLAALAFYAAGRHVLGWALAGLSAVYHVSVYAAGDRLLEPDR